MNLRDQIRELEEYYRRRAHEYDEIYTRDDPLRQPELVHAAARMREVVAGRHVLEIACGTGYWTEIASEVAADVVATDLSTEMIDVARRRRHPRANVRFVVADAYRLGKVSGDFNAAIANFWISHVPKSSLQAFLSDFHNRLEPGAVVFMIDNLNTPGYGGEFVRVPDSEDTFKLRELSDGSKHRIIKNYFESQELRDLLEPYARDIVIDRREHYWWLDYSARAVRGKTHSPDTD
jgi:ubiquinone/menaquinone biosynthesis C-methylase UbiE